MSLRNQWSARRTLQPTIRSYCSRTATRSRNPADRSARRSRTSARSPSPPRAAPPQGMSVPAPAAAISRCIGRRFSSLLSTSFVSSVLPSSAIRKRRSMATESSACHSSNVRSMLGLRCARHGQIQSRPGVGWHVAGSSSLLFARRQEQIILAVPASTLQLPALTHQPGRQPLRLRTGNHVHPELRVRAHERTIVHDRAASVAGLRQRYLGDEPRSAHDVRHIGQVGQPRPDLRR